MSAPAVQVYPSTTLRMPPLRTDSETSFEPLQTDKDDKGEAAASTPAAARETKYEQALRRASAEVQSLREENARLFAVNQTLLSSPTVPPSSKEKLYTHEHFQTRRQEDAEEAVEEEDEEAFPPHQAPPKPIDDHREELAGGAYEQLLEEHRNALQTLTLLRQHAASLEHIIEQWREKCTDMQTETAQLQGENAHLREELSLAVQNHLQQHQLQLSSFHSQQAPQRSMSPSPVPATDDSVLTTQRQEIERLRRLEIEHAVQQKELEHLQQTLKAQQRRASDERQAIAAQTSQRHEEEEEAVRRRQEQEARFEAEKASLIATFQKRIERLEQDRATAPTTTATTAADAVWSPATIASYLQQHLRPNPLPSSLAPLAPHFDLLNDYAEQYQHACLLLRDVFALTTQQEIPRHTSHGLAPRPFYALLQELHKHYIAQCHVTQQLQATSKRQVEWERALDKVKKAGIGEQRRRRQAEAQIKALTDLLGDYFAVSSANEVK